MANICEKCGKKIGFFATQIEFDDAHVMCSDCSAPIMDDLHTLLYSTHDSVSFNNLKNVVLKKCSEHYTEDIQNQITNLIDHTYKYSTFRYAEEEKNQIIKQKELIDNFKLTTGYEFCGYEIKEYIGVFSGQVVLGTGFLSELSASITDFLGEESNRFAEKLESAKNAATKKLILKSREKGGNAIIGVDFDYINFPGNMIGVIANGTSVIIEKKV